jgi:hypothetical protein
MQERYETQTSVKESQTGKSGNLHAQVAGIGSPDPETQYTERTDSASGIDFCNIVLEPLPDVIYSPKCRQEHANCQGVRSGRHQEGHQGRRCPCRQSENCPEGWRKRDDRPQRVRQSARRNESDYERRNETKLLFHGQGPQMAKPGTCQSAEAAAPEILQKQLA